MSEITVLIVDDVSQARNLTKMILSGLGVHQVFTANDGCEAQEFLEASGAHVDLVVCDWRMPRMSGLELLKQIRTIHPKMPFIMVTGNADVESVRAASELDVSAYIRKPYSPQQFEEKVVAVLDKMGAKSEPGRQIEDSKATSESLRKKARIESLRRIYS
ncbi:MAG: response regulator [Proteobacteria bacterium]|nr:response regulator [Pseudomonadota bacterium]